MLFRSNTQGWWFYVFLIGTTIFMFGAVPFTDTMIVRYIEDGMRSRVTGMRLAMSLSVSSFALWVMGPLVKSWGFNSMLWILAGFAAMATLAVMGLPKESKPAG